MRWVYYRKLPSKRTEDSGGLSMEGSVMQKLAEALDDVGFVIKRIEEIAYDQYDRPPSGEKYTGEIIIKIRPIKDEEADIEKIRVRKEEEKARSKALTPVTVSASEAES
jgi:hypothetical protein